MTTKKHPAKKPSRKKRSTRRSPAKPSDTANTQPENWTAINNRRNYELLAPILNSELARKRIEKICHVFEHDEGDGNVFAFKYAGGAKPGIVALDFYAYGLADWSAATARRILQEVTAEIRQHESDQGDVVEDGANGDDAMNVRYEDSVAHTARLLVPLFIEMIEGKMFSLLGEAELEAECFVKSVYLKMAGINPYAHIEALAKEIAAERRRHLRKSVDRFGSPSWGKGQALFGGLLSKAKEAREVYEHNKKNQNWPAMIKAGFPEFDEDLIMLLDKHADRTRLTEQAQEAADKEDYSQPANMALEAAARLCGMEPFKLGPRRIRELMKDSPPAIEMRHQDHREKVMRALEKNSASARESEANKSETVH